MEKLSALKHSMFFKGYIMKSLITALCVMSLGFSAVATANNQAFQSGIMEATGFGTVDMNKVSNKVQARFMAKRAAQVDAQRNLAEQIRGIRLTAGTTVEDYEVTSDVIATRVKGTLEGSFILDSQLVEEDGTYVATVKVGLCFTAKSSQCRSKPNLQQSLLEVLPPKNEKVETYQSSKNVVEPPATAFVLDATHSNYSASLQTRVFTETGKLVLSSSDFTNHPTKSLIWSRDAAEFDVFSPKKIKVSRIANGSDLVVSEDDANALLQNINNASLDGILVVLSK